MHLVYDHLGNGKPKSHPSLVDFLGYLKLSKKPKQIVEVAGRDTYPCINDLNLESLMLFCLFASDLESDLPLVSELYSISDQVKEYLFDSFRI